MTDQTRPSILQNFDANVAGFIARNRKMTEMDALRLFLSSETHRMLTDDKNKLWYFSPLAVFDMWEKEVSTGTPMNSLYLCGDEHE